MEMFTPSQQGKVDEVRPWLQTEPTVRDSCVAELIAWLASWKWSLYGGDARTLSSVILCYPLTAIAPSPKMVVFIFFVNQWIKINSGCRAEQSTNSILSLSL